MVSVVSDFDGPMFKYGDGWRTSAGDVADDDVARCR
jgi:hypothetical protein